MLIKFEVKIELVIIGIICLLKWEEQVSNAVRGEHRLAKDTHDLEHRSANLEVMFNDGNETVGDDGDMNLDADGILRLSPKSLDTEMLLDPFEKQLDLPPIFIKQGDFPSFEQEVVRVVDKAAVKLWSIVHNPSDDAWILLLVLLLGKAYALVFENIVGSFKDTLPVDNLECRFALLPNDEEGTECVDAIESGEVKVASVKHIARQRLVCKPIHRVDIVNLCIGNSVEYGDFRSDVNLCVNPDARLGTPELRPSEYGHAEVDGSRVDGIEPAMQFKLLGNSFGLGDAHHVEGELFKDSVVSESVGLRKHLPVDGITAKAEEDRFLCMGNSDICKFPEGCTARKLPKHENQQVIPVGHGPSFGPVLVLGDNAPELPLREKLCNLRENVCSNVHICSDFESDAKVHISRFGQGVVLRKCCV